MKSFGIQPNFPIGHLLQIFLCQWYNQSHFTTNIAIFWLGPRNAVVKVTFDVIWFDMIFVLCLKRDKRIRLRAICIRITHYNKSRLVIVIFRGECLKSESRQIWFKEAVARILSAKFWNFSFFFYPFHSLNPTLVLTNSTFLSFSRSFSTLYSSFEQIFDKRNPLKS